MYKNSTVSLIIPCFNEAPRIANVIKPALKSKYLDEIIVVDDASTDNSVAVILDFDGKVKLFRNKKNTGKAGAVFTGIKNASSDFIFLMDADLVGLRPRHLDESIEQAVDFGLDMLLVPLGGEPIKKSIYDFVGSNTILTGQRIIRRKKIYPYTKNRNLGFGLEMHLNNLAEKNRWKTDVILWKKLSLPETPLKVEKYGFLTGIKGEFKMLSQIKKGSKFVEYLNHYKKFIIQKSPKSDWLKLFEQ